MKPSGSARLTVSSVTFIQRNKVLGLRSVRQAGVDVTIDMSPGPG